MKGKIHALALLLGCAAVPQAHAGWFDWVTPSEWFAGNTGFYAGGGLNVATVNGLLDRRLGGDGDQESAGNEQFRILEPGYNTLLQVRGGWQVLPFLAIEAQYNLPLDADDIENADNTQQLKLDSIYGIYLKPRIAISEAVSLVGTLGYSEFDYSINRVEGGADENSSISYGGQTGGDSENQTFGGFGDGGLAWGGAIQLRLTQQTRIAFEYTQHYDESQTFTNGAGTQTTRDVDLYQVGFTVTYLFGDAEASGGGDDEYY